VDILQRQIRRARRRLAAQRFLDALVWCWFGTLLAALGVVVLDRFRPLGIDAWVWTAGALALGLVAAAIWSFCVRSSLLEAAIELDHRFGLKERTSSALAISPAEQETAAGEALLADAVARVQKLDVGGRFVVKPSRRLLLPLAPGVAAALVALLIGQVVQQPAQASADATAVAEQIKKSTEVVRRELAAHHQQAKKEDLKEAERVFTKLEQGLKAIKAEPVKEKALAKLNDLSRMLADRRQQLGGENAKELAKQVKDIDRGPADKFAKAMSRGDFQKAAEELKKLQSELASGKLGDKEKQELAKQCEQMRNALEKQAQAWRDAQKDLERQVAQCRKNGQTAQADKLEEQLNNLRQQSPDVQRMLDVAQKLGQCAKCMRQGNCQNAAQTLAQMESDMRRQLAEMEMLDDAQQQLGQAKQCMGCKKCGGAGCEECLGQCGGKEMGLEREGGGHGGGIGWARGRNFVRGKPVDAKLYDSQVKQKVGPGAAVVTGTIDGPNVRGNVQQQIQQQVDSVRRGETDPLSNRRLPRKHGEHAKEYLEGLNGG
jgi:hypothetical protein